LFDQEAEGTLSFAIDHKIHAREGLQQPSSGTSRKHGPPNDDRKIRVSFLDGSDEVERRRQLTKTDGYAGKSAMLPLNAVNKTFRYLADLGNEVLKVFPAEARLSLGLAVKHLFNVPCPLRI
jgi:hypothetical protein